MMKAFDNKIIGCLYLCNHKKTLDKNAKKLSS